MIDEAQGISRLSKEDLEMIERIASRYSDDTAVSVARSFERLEERIDAAEARLYSRLNDLEEAFAEED
jgi:flagellar capping protein FliD